MLESGVDRIITQVVDPKMNHTFRPHIETAIHDFLSGDRKDENNLGCNSVPSEQNEPQEAPTASGPKTPWWTETSQEMCFLLLQVHVLVFASLHITLHGCVCLLKDAASGRRRTNSMRRGGHYSLKTWKDQSQQTGVLEVFYNVPVCAAWGYCWEGWMMQSGALSLPGSPFYTKLWIFWKICVLFFFSFLFAVRQKSFMFCRFSA